MERWNREAAMRLVDKVKMDMEHRDLLRCCREAEAEYLEVMGRLENEERMKVEDYVASCEELVYREVQLAYELGLFWQYK